jgi:hypothetical protein
MLDPNDGCIPFIIFLWCVVQTCHMQITVFKINEQMITHPVFVPL